MQDPGNERRSQQRRPANWTARVLAPLALAVAAGVVVILVAGSLDESGERGKRGDGDGRIALTEGCSPDAEGAVENGYYVIEPGEDLSLVADRTCVPIDEIEKLNPNLDPQLIQVGSCVDLVVDGCKALAEQ